MTIYRTEHKKNYTVVNNYIIKDKRLSWKAKAIWLYAFSRPDDWTFHENDIINQSTDKRDSVRSGLKELEDCGYLRRSRNRKADGTFDKDSEWVFHETPLTDTSEPRTENPILENPILENHPLLSTDKKPSIETSPTTSKIDDDDPLKDFDILVKVLDKSKNAGEFSKPSNRATLLKLSKQYSAKLVGQIIAKFVHEKPRLKNPMGWLTETVKDQYELFKYKQREGIK
jgi:hypothetical protein